MFLHVIPQRREKSASPYSGSHPYQEGGIFRFPVLASSSARVPGSPNLAGVPWRLRPLVGTEFDACHARQLAQLLIDCAPPHGSGPAGLYPFFDPFRYRPVSSSPRFPLADQEHLMDVLRVLRQVEEGRREVGARDVVRTVGEVLPPHLGSNPARLGSVREIRRSDNGPLDRARSNEPLHPRKVCIRLSQNPADEIDHDPRPQTFDRRDAHTDEAPDTGSAHRIELGARDVAHYLHPTPALG